MLNSLRNHWTLGCLISLATTLGAAELPFGAQAVIEDGYLSPTSVTTGDLDGDGYEDIVAAAYNDNTIAWWRSLGNGAFTRYDIAVSVADIDDVEVADINGDGHPDVVVTSAGNTDAVGWFENDGTPTVGSWPLRLIAFPFDGAAGTAVGDVDLDGTLDVAAVASSAHLVSVAFNNTGTGIGWSYEVVDPYFTGAHWVSMGDLDHDGDLDVAAAALVSGEISWWSRDSGGGAWTEHPITTVASAVVIELVDMDQDGDLDALGAGTTSAIRWWENNGAGGGWAEHTVADPIGNVWAAYTADLDLDGDPDIIYAVDGADGVGWYENTAGDALTWEVRLVDGAFDNAVDVAAADFNLDGDLDLVLLAEDRTTSDAVQAWYENSLGDGTVWIPHVLDTDFVRPHTLVAADLDGDGDPDLAVGSVASEIRWWSNRGGQAALATLGTAPATLEPMILGEALEITAIHRGRAGDGDAEVASIDLLLTDGLGIPLTDSEADALLFGVYVFEDDDDSGDFDPGFDTEVAAVETFSLVDGVLTMEFVDGGDHLRFNTVTNRTLFVAFAFESDAAAQTPAQIEFEHLNSSSRVEDRDHDLPLQLERLPDVSSGVVAPSVVSNSIFADGFESGDTSAWSDSAP